MELQNKIPLVGEVHIEFLSKRKGQMTTGSFTNKKHLIKVLFKERMLADVLRTLSHEWVHEYQHQKMGVRDDVPIQDIGGPEENMASVLASIFLKKFQSEFPNYEKYLYKQLHK